MAPATNCMICAYPSKLTCSACKSAWYCGSGCQKLAWLKHKKLCKILQLPPAQRPDKSTYCELCGKTGGETLIMDCCGATVCDDEHTYQLMSYARNSCSRNHRRYTSCGSHYAEGHVDRPGDSGWQDCKDCTTGNKSWSPENTAWYCTNNFCTGERIDQDKVPAFEPAMCIVCKKHIKLQLESYSPAGDGKVTCGGCFA